jgi:hypothetical protein
VITIKAHNTPESAVSLKRFWVVMAPNRMTDQETLPRHDVIGKEVSKEAFPLGILNPQIRTEGKIWGRDSLGEESLVLVVHSPTKVVVTCTIPTKTTKSKMRTNISSTLTSIWMT